MLTPSSSSSLTVLAPGLFFLDPVGDDDDEDDDDAIETLSPKLLVRLRRARSCSLALDVERMPLGLGELARASEPRFRPAREEVRAIGIGKGFVDEDD